MEHITTSNLAYIEDDNLGEVPSSLREELTKLASQSMSPGVLLHWYQLIKGQDVLVPSYVNEALAPQSYMDIDEHLPTTTEAPHTDPVYPCPWCTIELKLPKDFIRHVKQKCSATEIFCCPDCPKTFTRKQRFAKHHGIMHAFECGRGPCRHIKKATVTLPQERTLGCGFCKQLFHSDLHGYLRHLIGHYREGLTLASWHAGPFVPVSVEHMDAPQIMLDAEIVDHSSSSDFSALRSGFGLSSDFEWLETDLPSSTSLTLYDRDQSCEISKGNLEDGPYWQQDITLPGLAPNQYCSHQHVPLQHPDPTTPTTAFFRGMGHHINDPSITIYTPSQTTTSWSHQSPSSTTTEACAALIAEREHSNSFDGNDYILPYSDLITPLPQKKDHRRSLSKRIFHALQSLPVLRSD